MHHAPSSIIEHSRKNRITKKTDVRTILSKELLTIEIRTMEGTEHDMYFQDQISARLLIYKGEVILIDGPNPQKREPGSVINISLNDGGTLTLEYTQEGIMVIKLKNAKHPLTVTTTPLLKKTTGILKKKDVTIETAIRDIHKNAGLVVSAEL